MRWLLAAFTFCFLIVGPSSITAQSLVLAGDLSEYNAPVWNRMVELAVIENLTVN